MDSSMLYSLYHGKKITFRAPPTPQVAAMILERGMVQVTEHTFSFYDIDDSDAIKLLYDMQRLGPRHVLYVTDGNVTIRMYGMTPLKAIDNLIENGFPPDYTVAIKGYRPELYFVADLNRAKEAYAALVEMSKAAPTTIVIKRNGSLLLRPYISTFLVHKSHEWFVPHGHSLIVTRKKSPETRCAFLNDIMTESISIEVNLDQHNYGLDGSEMTPVEFVEHLVDSGVNGNYNIVVRSHGEDVATTKLAVAGIVIKALQGGTG